MTTTPASLGLIERLRDENIAVSRALNLEAATAIEELLKHEIEDSIVIGRLNSGAELQAVMKINNELVDALTTANKLLAERTAIFQDNLRNGWAALRMIREAVEEFGPATSLEGPDAVLLRGPEPVHEAAAIVDALSRLSKLLAAPVGDEVEEAVKKLDEVFGLLQIASHAGLKQRLQEQGANLHLPHEVRLFAMKLAEGDMYGGAYADGRKTIHEIAALLRRQARSVAGMREADLDQLALNTARKIDATGNRTYVGGRAQRLAAIQVIVRKTLVIALSDRKEPIDA